MNDLVLNIYIKRGIFITHLFLFIYKHIVDIHIIILQF